MKPSVARHFVLLVATCALGCDFSMDGFLSDGPGPDRSEAEYGVTRIAERGQISDVEWVADDEYLVYMDGSGHSASAFQVSTGERVPLARSAGWISSFAVSADLEEFVALVDYYSNGSRYFVLFAGGDSTTAFEAPTAGFSMTQADGAPVIAARALARFAMILGTDSVVVLDRGQPPRLVGWGCSTLFEFSPEDDQLLCGSNRDRQSPVMTINVETGATTVHARPADGFTWGGFRWGANGPEMRSWEGTINLATGERNLSGWSKSGTESESPAMAWSRDGTVTMHATTFCAQPDGFLSCAKIQYFIYVHHEGVPGWHRVAVIDQPPRTGLHPYLALSARGTRFAVSVGGELYVTDTSGG